MAAGDQLPQLDGDPFLTDGGIETVLIFQEGIDLPLFAAFDLLDDEEGTEELRRYYEPYVALARERGDRLRAREPDLACESPLGGRARLRHGRARRSVNRAAIALLEEIRDAQGEAGPPIVISGCIGPAGRRLQPRGAALRGGGPRLPLDSGRDLRRDRAPTWSRRSP